MYLQSFFNEKNDRLLHAVNAREYVRKSRWLKDSFLQRALVADILLWIKKFLLILTENAVGSSLYVENEWRELAGIHPGIRNLILRLLTKRFIISWKKFPAPVDQPRIAYYGVRLGEIKSPSGKSLVLQGSVGNGVGINADVALTRAIAESFERYSLSVWNPKSIVHSSFEELKSKGAVNPKKFSFFSEKQHARALGGQSGASEHQRFGWSSAISFVDEKVHD